MARYISIAAFGHLPCHHFFSSLVSYSSGVLVPGGFGLRGVEGKVAAVKWARERKIPFLGKYAFACCCLHN